VTAVKVPSGVALTRAPVPGSDSESPCRAPSRTASMVARSSPGPASAADDRAGFGVGTHVSTRGSPVPTGTQPSRTAVSTCARCCSSSESRSRPRHSRMLADELAGPMCH